MLFIIISQVFKTSRPATLLNMPPVRLLNPVTGKMVAVTIAIFFKMAAGFTPIPQGAPQQTNLPFPRYANGMTVNTSTKPFKIATPSALTANDTPAQYSFRKLRWNSAMALRTSLITYRPFFLKKKHESTTQKKFKESQRQCNKLALLTVSCTTGCNVHKLWILQYYNSIVCLLGWRQGTTAAF